jgi:hypothetical protein
MKILFLVLFLSGCALTTPHLIETMRENGCELQSYAESGKTDSRIVICK